MAEPATTQATFCATLVDEWARAGVRHAVIAPGSRSTPLALALLRDGRIEVHVHHDERCVAFMALGLGLATMDGVATPAIALCTSGTAATHFHAAVVEAHQAGVPMLVCTADRPPELRDVGAPQAIDQTHLFGRAPRWFFDPGVADEGSRHTWRRLASRAVAEARSGPVHLNLPFREPLVGSPDDLPKGRVERAPWTDFAGAEPASTDHIPSSGKGVVLSFGGTPPFEASHWKHPVLAGPQSGYVGSLVIARADAFLRVPAIAEELAPDVVLRIGRPPASRVVNEWVAASGAVEIVDTHGASDPYATAAFVGEADPWTWPAPPGGWLERWHEIDRLAENAIAAVLADHPEPTEPFVARTLLARLPAGAHLVVASSMPIRDLEWYATPRRDVTVHANRGANGVDGTISTAVGVALATGLPTAVLLGDIAFLHDSNALIGAARRDIHLTIVVVDNDGGGIFSFLPQASSLSTRDYELLFGTPHGVRPEAIAEAHGIESHVIDAADELGRAIEASAATGGVRLIVTRTTRVDNRRLHDELHEAVARAVTA